MGGIRVDFDPMHYLSILVSQTDLQMPKSISNLGEYGRRTDRCRGRRRTFFLLEEIPLLFLSKRRKSLRVLLPYRGKVLLEQTNNARRIAVRRC